jgi:enoyl-CoA hydratase/carnithine racemase
MPGCGGTQRILELTNKSTAVKLMLHGNTFSADDALQFKLVDKIVKKNEILNTAINIAKNIQQKKVLIKNFKETNDVSK